MQLMLVKKYTRAINPKGWWMSEKLDGELWRDRDRFNETVGIVRSHGGNWSGIKYMVFDLIQDRERFEDRLKKFLALSLPAHCHEVTQEKCKGYSHTDAFEHDILSKGGEGVILREACSYYEHKRSSRLLKLKPLKSAETVVTGYALGKGKHAGRIGVLVCDYAGKVLRLGTGLAGS